MIRVAIRGLRLAPSATLMHNDPMLPEVDAASNPATPAQEARWTRAWHLTLLGFIVVRAAYAAVFPLDLAPDESYYWDWGRRLDLGYYSKPPMIGWLMGLAGWIGNNSFVTLKLFPAAFTAAGLHCVFLLGRAMFGARAGFWSSLLLIATPGNVILGTFFTIDAPLFFFWSASLWFAWNWWSTPGSRGFWTIALIVSMGLGSLTKQIHWTFPLLFLAFMIVSGFPGTGPSRLQFLAAVCGSLLFLIPPALWNWQHDWITIRHTTEELQTPARDVRQILRNIGDFIGGQAALGGGITWLGLVGAAVFGLRRGRAADPRFRFLWCFFAPGLLAYTALSFLQRTEQNWPLVFYTSGMVLLGGLAAGSARPQMASGPWPRLAFCGVILGGILACAVMTVPFVLPHSKWAGAPIDATARVRGWRALSEYIDQVRRGVPRPDSTFLLAPDDRYVASALAFYLPDHPRTYCWGDTNRPKTQYDMWGRPVEVGWDALIIGRNPESPKFRDASGHFRNCIPLGEYDTSLGPGQRRARKYVVLLGRDYLGLERRNSGTNDNR